MPDKPARNKVGVFFSDAKAEVKRWFDSVKELYALCKKFVLEDIWKLDTSNFGTFKKVVINRLKVLINIVKDITKNKNLDIGRNAVALSFYSVFAVIPMLAFAFFITDGLGLDRKLEILLYKTFSGNEALLKRILSFSDNIINNCTQNWFGIISAGVFFWTILYLILNIEKFFNETWDAPKRKLGTSVVYNIGVIIISPFLVLLLLSVCAFFANDNTHYGISLFNNIGLNAFLQWLVYYIICIGIFTVVNKYVPNTSVKWEASFRASLLEGLFFVMLQFLYTNTQLFVSRMNTIYGAVAAFPLFLIWLNWCWTIILAGAEICKQYQHTLLSPAIDLPD